MSELLDEIEVLLRKGEIERAFGLVKDKDTDSLAGGLIERIIFHIKNEEYDFAGTYFEFLEKIAIDNGIKEKERKHLANAYLNCGNAYAKKKDFDRAIEDYKKAIKFNPEYAGAYYNRGLAYGKKGKFDNAIEDYNKAIGFNPDFADAYTNRGSAYNAKEDFDRAIEDYKKGNRFKS
ncbi:Photosystem I assembly protein Ycf3 [ANME-1 cluster archaeon GoMg2]|nr:Photosystem I assembly protein Ycf3 [ANME-1 cluster archaeon GoMg2]